MLVSKMRGHYAYYGITGNGRGICGFEHHVRQIWRKWLDRRGSNRSMGWEKFKRMLERYPLPPAVVVHSMYRRPASMVS